MKMNQIVAFLITAIICQSQSQQNGWKSPLLLEALEQGLLNGTTNFKNLQTVFYPINYIQTGTVIININQQPCDLTVMEIHGSIGNPAFVPCSSIGAFCCTNCYCLNSTLLQFHISSVNSESYSKLQNYVNSPGIVEYIKFVDTVSFLLFNALTHSGIDTKLSSEYSLEAVDIEFHIDELTSMPTKKDMILDLKRLFVWIKYYVRSYGNILTTERRDSDRVIVCESTEGERCNSGMIRSTEIVITGLLYTLNFIIAMIGIYYTPRLVQQYSSYFEGDPQSKNGQGLYFKTLAVDELAGKLDELYLAIVLVCGFVDIGCTVVHLTPINISLTSSEFDKKIIPLMIIIFVTEFASVLYQVRGFKLSNTPNHCCRHCLIILLHTLAICSILWFLRWLGCNLIVAIFFIALAPAQTLAAIALIYSVIASTIMTVTYILYCLRRLTSRVILVEIFPVSVFYFLIVAFLTLLTILFNELAENGLTSSGLGSIILSLVAPTLVFLITLKLKQQLEISFKEDKEDLHKGTKQATEKTPLTH